MANIIFKSLTNDTHVETLVSAQSLSKTLLRSANFYEAKCFKGMFVYANFFFFFSRFADDPLSPPSRSL